MKNIGNMPIKEKEYLIKNIVILIIAKTDIVTGNNTLNHPNLMNI